MLWTLFLPLLGLLFGTRPSSAQSVNLMNLTAPYHDFSATCISVLNQAVTCDPRILHAGRDGKFESDETLTRVCTTACTNSLTTWMRRVTNACGTATYIDGKASVLAAFLGQVRIEQYSALCLKDRQGKFCNAVVRSAMSSMTGTPGSDFACNTCVASLISTQLQMPIGATSTQLKQQYESMTSSCKLSSMSVTPLATTTKWVSMAPSPTPTCVGTQYSIKSTDNCRSISLGSGISTTNLLTSNRLQAFCANFPTSGTVCIPSAKVCRPHQLKVDLTDTCASVARTYDVTWTQIVSWNPEVGEYCDNLKTLAKSGMVICVTQPGGPWTNPSPQPPKPTTTAPETYFTQSKTVFSSLPTATIVWNESNPFPMFGHPNPIANGTVLDCNLIRPPPVRIMPSWEDSYRCSDFAKVYNTTMADLILWNPSLSTRMVDGDCELWAGQQYCSRRDLDESNLATDYCFSTEVAETGPAGTCDGFVSWHGLDKASFLEWNKGPGPNCENFRTGNAYCVSVRHFRPAEQISTCSRWHMATDVKTTACADIEKQYGLQHARFVAWNPTVKSDCTGLKLNYDYCVGTPTFPGTGG